MLIEFECTNIAEYDAATGRYVPCGKRLIVSEDKLGEMVRCGKCKQLVEVPLDAGQSSPRPSEGPARDKSRPAVAATKSTRQPPKTAGGGGAKISADRLPPPDPYTFEFESTPAATTSEYTKYENRCPKCGAPINDQGKCTACRYVEQQFPSAYLPLDKIDMQLAGFQKWFSDILSEGVSMTLLVWAAHGTALLFSALMLLVGFLMGGTSGTVLIVLVLLFDLFYVGMAYKGYALRWNPRAQLGWFQRPLWNGLLSILRMTGWKNFDNRNYRRRVLDRRNAPLLDENLATLEGIERYQVLDLEGTLITDRALRQLYGHKHLQLLVVRRTKVTSEGVVRLQQANPDLWIWS